MLISKLCFNLFNSFENLSSNPFVMLKDRGNFSFPILLHVKSRNIRNGFELRCSMGQNAACSGMGEQRQHKSILYDIDYIRDDGYRENELENNRNVYYKNKLCKMIK